MIGVLTAEDVRRQDADAIARGLTIESLMETAGAAVARAARRMMGGTYGRRVVVVCGKGNNGGDGLVAARVLHQRGAAVTVVLAFPEHELNEHASQQLARFGGRRASDLERELGRADVIVDAIFGVGLSRAPEGDAARAISLIGAERDAGRARVLAVDVPSGIDADTGRIVATSGGIPAVRADATVTLGGFKAGLMFEPGRSLAGVVEVADIGARGPASGIALDASDIATWWPLRRPAEHKRSAGTVLVVAGSRAMPGAAALACGASVHAGAGLTVLCAPEEVCDVVVGSVPEITTIPIPSTSEGTIDVKALDMIRPRFDEFHAIAVGPGLTTHPATAEFVRALVDAAPAPVVLDADGINAFAGAADQIAARAPRTTILTPHAAELGRLVDASAADLDADRLGNARRAAERLGCVLVFKGPGTVVAAKGLRSEPDRAIAFVNPTGGAALAQGGTGDVLTGLLASVVAQTCARARPHTPPVDVVAFHVAAAVWMHGHAADRIARRIAPHPANATALIAELGPALNEVCA
jgi:NAD(P)H-hydrate epimerase